MRARSGIRRVGSWSLVVLRMLLPVGASVMAMSATAEANPGWSTSLDTFPRPLTVDVVVPSVATTLPSGKVVVLGNDTYAELFDPQSGAWSSLSPYPGDNRSSSHVATTLASGDVFALIQPSYQPLTAAVYDPHSDGWTPVPPDANRFSCLAPRTSVVLPSGAVLIAGWSNSFSDSSCSGSPHHAVLYDPKTNSWSNAAPPLGAYISSLVLLSTGKVLSNDGEIYDPQSDSWSAIAQGPVVMNGNPTITLLPSGSVLAVGSNSDFSSITSAVYDPQTNSWLTAGSPSVGQWSASVLLQSGKVLEAGGWRSSQDTDAVDLYDPGTNTWAPQPALHEPEDWIQQGLTGLAFPLPSGNALLVGAHQLNAYPEIYHASTAIPTARLRVPPSEPNPTRGVPFSVDGSHSNDPVGTLASWSYDFGDGSPAASGLGAPPAAIQHTYMHGGTYRGTLTVTGSSGLTDTSRLVIDVFASPTTLTADPALIDSQSSSSARLDALTAHLSVTYDKSPVPGKVITFTANNSFVCQATTDATGTATCSGLAPSMITSNSYVAAFAGDMDYANSWAYGTLIR